MQRMTGALIFRALQPQIERMTMEPRDHGGPIIKFWEESGTLEKLEQAIMTPHHPHNLFKKSIYVENIC